MKKCIVISDSFKGSLPSRDICAIARERIPLYFPACEVRALNVADGGEGTVDCFLDSCGGERVLVSGVQNPYGEPIDAAYGLLPDGTAVVEMAAAAGLPLVAGRKNPCVTTTYGVGQLIADALARGARRIVLGLGGSATNDGGCGCAAALGIHFLDRDGVPFVPVGGTLDRLDRIDASGLDPAVRAADITVMCDIDNPLCGPNGASAVFGPQKGATPEQVALLDQALSRYASVLSSQLGSDAAQRDGAGAAGGIGCAMMAFFGASFLSGIDLVLDAAGFSTAVAGADLVLTGEGQLDAQSAYGKVPCGVARRAKAVRNVPVLAIGGALGDGAESLYSCGVDALASTVSRITTLESAMANAVASIEETTARTMRLLDAGRKMEQNKVS